MKALFKIKDTELDFAHAFQVAIETEHVARFAKETVYGSKTSPVKKVKQRQNKGQPKNYQQPNFTEPEYKCYRCEKAHKDCPYKEVRHLEAVFPNFYEENNKSRACQNDPCDDTSRLVVPIAMQD